MLVVNGYDYMLDKKRLRKLDNSDVVLLLEMHEKMLKKIPENST